MTDLGKWIRARKSSVEHTHPPHGYAMTNRRMGSGLCRRDVLRLGVSGAWGLCLAALLGCGRREPALDTKDAQTTREGEENQANRVNEGNQESGSNQLASQSGGPSRGFARPVPSPWYTAVAGGMVRCELCPNGCELAPGGRGICRVRENREGVLYSLAYGNPVMVQDDPVERNPFFHVHPGSRALSISTAGCNLACQFCEVWDMALVAPEDVYAHDMPPERVLEHAQATGVTAVSYSFGEPVVFYEYMVAIAALVKQTGMLNLLQTAGYIQPTPLEELSPYLDAANIDLKGFDPAFYGEAVGGELEPVLRTLKQLREAGIHIEITNLLIPTMNDHMETVAEMCRWIAGELGPEVPLHFARFYPLYRLMDLPRTPVSTLEEARETALQVGLKFVYLARVPGHEGENTFCPACRSPIISREGFMVDQIHLEDGRCGFCGRTIPGVWA